MGVKELFKHEKPHKKHEYRSEPAEAAPKRGDSFTKRGAPELVVNEAPTRAPFSRGVEEGHYKFQHESEERDDDGTAPVPGSAPGDSGGPAPARRDWAQPAGEGPHVCIGLHVVCSLCADALRFLSPSLRCAAGTGACMHLQAAYIGPSPRCMGRLLCLPACQRSVVPAPGWQRRARLHCADQRPGARQAWTASLPGARWRLKRPRRPRRRRRARPAATRPACRALRRGTACGKVRALPRVPTLALTRCPGCCFAAQTVALRADEVTTWLPSVLAASVAAAPPSSHCRPAPDCWAGAWQSKAGRARRSRRRGRRWRARSCTRSTWCRRRRSRTRCGWRCCSSGRTRARWAWACPWCAPARAARAALPPAPPARFLRKWAPSAG